MRTLVQGLIAVTALSACASPYEAFPTSSAQWQQRQEAIEQREAERRRICETLPANAGTCPREKAPD